MITRILTYFRERPAHKRLDTWREQTAASELLLTDRDARAYDRDARSYASWRANGLAASKRLRDHRLAIEVSAMRGGA